MLHVRLLSSIVYLLFIKPRFLSSGPMHFAPFHDSNLEQKLSPFLIQIVHSVSPAYLWENYPYVQVPLLCSQGR